MKAATSATLDKLARVDWFRNVGVNDTDAADVLGSWDKAMESCGSLQWEWLTQEAVNQYCSRISERSPERFRFWNEVVLVVRPAALELARAKTDAVIRANALPKVFLNTVAWDVLHLCMEAEFSDVYPPGFFASQAYWYAAGHFPCGWQGEFPDGKLIVY